MISLEFIRNNLEEVKKICQKRGVSIDIHEFLELDNQLRSKIHESDSLRYEKKQLKGTDEVTIKKAVAFKKKISNLDKEIKSIDSKRDHIWAQIPNILDESVPEGLTEKDNVTIKKWGDIRNFDFQPEWHDKLAESLGILNIKRGTRVASSGFAYWIGDGAKLVHALFNFTLDILQNNGFEYLMTPLLAKEKTLFGTGYLPFFEDQIYKLEGLDLSLIGTSEQTLVGYYMDEIIDEPIQPKLFTAYTPCFRTEAGSYGKETRGIFRMHQFQKVEQIVFCLPEESEKWHEFCLKNEEQILQELGIPYRVVNVCAGDLGAPASKKYDIEAYFPAYGDYREVTSNSNLLDYQSRRLNIRYKKDGKTLFPHTISATGTTERVALAIIENYQNSDGTITIPKVLREYMGGKEIIKKSSLGD